MQYSILLHAPVTTIVQIKAAKNIKLSRTIIKNFFIIRAAFFKWQRMYIKT